MLNHKSKSPTNSNINQQIYEKAHKGSATQLQDLLTKEGINPNAQFIPNNNNALHVAKKNSNVIDQLIKAGFPLDIKNNQGQTTLAAIITRRDEDRVLPS